MYFLDEIVDLVNAQLKSSLNTSPFQKADFRGFAEIIFRATEKPDVFEQLPCIFDKVGTLPVTPDCRNSMLVYYRATDEDYIPTPGIGDGKKELKDTANVSMMVYAFRKAMQLNPRELNARLVDSIPDNLEVVEEGTGRKLLKCRVTPVKTNYQTKILLEREFGTQNYPELLSPENYFFEIKLKIESTYEKGCFKNCKCN